VSLSSGKQRGLGQAGAAQDRTGERKRQPQRLGPPSFRVLMRSEVRKLAEVVGGPPRLCGREASSDLVPHEHLQERPHVVQAFHRSRAPGAPLQARVPSIVERGEPAVAVALAQSQRQMRLQDPTNRFATAVTWRS